MNDDIKLYSIIQKNLLKKYSFNETKYNQLQIQRLLQNIPCHLVSLFKDYLIYDDNFEYNQKFYKISETNLRLEKIFLYYSTSSKIFPNYTVINEGKYLYQNIMKKQNIIDIIEDNKRKEKEKQLNEKKKFFSLFNLEEDDSKIFNTIVYNSILKENINDESKLKEIFGNEYKNENSNNNSIIKLSNILNDAIYNYEIKNCSFINNNNTSSKDKISTIDVTNLNNIYNKNKKISNNIKIKNFKIKSSLHYNFNSINKFKIIKLENYNNLMNKNNSNNNNIKKIIKNNNNNSSSLKIKNIKNNNKNLSLNYNNNSIFKTFLFNNKNFNNNNTIDSNTKSINTNSNTITTTTTTINNYNIKKNNNNYINNTKLSRNYNNINLNNNSKSKNNLNNIKHKTINSISILNKSNKKKEINLEKLFNIVNDIKSYRNPKIKNFFSLLKKKDYNNYLTINSFDKRSLDNKKILSPKKNIIYNHNFTSNQTTKFNKIYNNNNVVTFNNNSKSISTSKGKKEITHKPFSEKNKYKIKKCIEINYNINVY